MKKQPRAHVEIRDTTINCPSPTGLKELAEALKANADACRILASQMQTGAAIVVYGGQYPDKK